MNVLSKSSLAALLALSAVGAAQAQSSVTTYGLIDMSFGSNKVPGGITQTTVDSGKLTTSYFGFRGGEDLGGGLSAVFKLEQFLRADTGDQGRFTGDAMWSRNAYVGLSSKDYGTLTLGRNTTPLFVATLAFNAFGDSFGYSPSIRHYFTSGTVTGDSGWSDSVLYNSPSLGGFKFGLAAATKESAGGTSNGGNWSVDLGYSGGPLAATLVVQDVKKDGATPQPDTRTVQFGSSYDFGVAKAFLQVGKVDNQTTGMTWHLTDVGARVPVGAGAVLAQWGRLSPETGPERNTLSLGYSHSLSKRTELYAVGMRDKLDGLTTGHSYSVGVRHRF
jgi:predicted porin